MAVNAQKLDVWNFTVNVLPMGENAMAIVFVLVVETDPETINRSIKLRWWPISDTLNILKESRHWLQFENVRVKNQCARKNIVSVLALGWSAQNTVNAKIVKMGTLIAMRIHQMKYP